MNGMRCHHFGCVDSTNLQALRLWQQGLEGNEPLVVVAQRQTAGRGRTGRTWHSPEGGLWLTVSWPVHPPYERYQSLTVAIGLAVAEGIEEETSLECLIKWPNDVLIRGRKVAGILCQLEPSQQPPLLLVGVGINANLSIQSLEGPVRYPATSLEDELGQSVDLSRLTKRVVSRIESRARVFESEGFLPLQPEVERRLAWSGQDVRWLGPDEKTNHTGSLQGIDTAGRLRMTIQGKMQTLSVGEIARMSLIEPPRTRET